MIIRSRIPDVDVPSIPLTQFVLRRAQQFAGKPALVDGVTGRVIQYAQLNELINRAASGLSTLGFARGDVLAIYSPNLPEYAIAFHATATLGGVITTVNPLFTEKELGWQLKDAGARFIVTTPRLAAKARAAALAAGVQHFIVIGEETGAVSFESLLEDASPLPELTFDPQQTPSTCGAFSRPSTERVKLKRTTFTNLGEKMVFSSMVAYWVRMSLA